MSNKTPIAWGAATAQMRQGRAVPLPIREERLRTFRPVRDFAGSWLSAWRGKSGRRYVVEVHSVSTEVLTEAGPCLALAVGRDESGLARIFRATADIAPADVMNWVDSMRRAGATEMHVVSKVSAETAEERIAVLRDLTQPLAVAA